MGMTIIEKILARASGAAEISFDDFGVRNVTTGANLDGIAVPDQLLKIFKAGGIYPLLEAEGLIAPPT